MKSFIDKESFQDNPKELLIKCAEANKLKGSSTFVIACLSENNNILNYSYIGDSGKDFFQ
jgi:hypothetical protein